MFFFYMQGSRFTQRLVCKDVVWVCLKKLHSVYTQRTSMFRFVRRCVAFCIFSEHKRVRSRWPHGGAQADLAEAC